MNKGDTLVGYAAGVAFIAALFFAVAKAPAEHEQNEAATQAAIQAQGATLAGDYITLPIAQNEKE